MIQDTVRKLKDIEHINIDEKRAVIMDRLLQSQRKETHRMLWHFDLIVPHWFLSPWYNKKNKREIYELSQLEVDMPIYRLYRDN